MSTYTLSATVAAPFVPTVERVRSALTDVGFGIITEIDMAATMKTKLGVEMAPQLILGACRPALAHEALQADPSIAALLPCNVVVRSLSPEETVVEVFDPAFLAGLAGGDAVRKVAADARERLTALLDGLTKEI